MKILLLAYACEPNRGSEPGIGWKWAINLSQDKTKEIHVLTRANNRLVIEEYWKGNCPDNLFFHYYDLPAVILWAKHHIIPVNIYYALWLWKSNKLIAKLHKNFHFDLAHHITFGVFRDACFLYKHNIPYVIGPVGGGEETPKELMSLYSFKEQIKETLRSYMNFIALHNPFLIKTFDQASLILTKTKDTEKKLHRWSKKTTTYLELGINEIQNNKGERKGETFLFVGRFTYWKGIKLILLAFKKYTTTHPDAKLFFIGKGEMEKYINNYKENYNLEDNISIIPWIKQDELKRYYMTCRGLIFPSLHDSSGNVVLEALSMGLPVICLSCGGPAAILGDSLQELVVEVNNKSVPDVVCELNNKMEYLTNNSNDFSLISNRCLQQSNKYKWDQVVNSCYYIIQQKCNLS